jgi:hypothetical protein
LSEYVQKERGKNGRPDERHVHTCCKNADVIQKQKHFYRNATAPRKKTAKKQIFILKFTRNNE